MALRPLLAVLLVAATPAAAQTDRWYLTPNVTGPEDCGGECDEFATAWVNDPDGQWAFGVSCGGTMVLGGPATYVEQMPFDRAEIVVDGASFGQFQVMPGMNDVYISPLDGGETDWGKLGPALIEGEAMELRTGDGRTLPFTLGRAKEAMQGLALLCGY